MHVFQARILNKTWASFSIFIGIAFILYFPILNNEFASDDFNVMRRVGLEGKVIVNGFFRPLSDITLYFNYWMGKFNPVYYNVFNVAIHGITSFIFYLFCKRSASLYFGIKQNETFAWIVAIIFITYPFHNESVVWVVGRASLMAAFFGVACLLAVVSDINIRLKYFLAGLFYFIGLSSYESIFPIPVMVLILVWKKEQSYRSLITWIIVFGAFLTAHFILRISFSENITGSYAEGIFSLSYRTYFSHFFKILGRMFLPPMENSLLLTVLFVVVVILFLIGGLLIFFNSKYSEVRMAAGKAFLLLLVSLIVPVTFAVSTKTSEADRLLYFPSLFLCFIYGLIILEMITIARLRSVFFCVLLIYNIVFLQLNNNNWKTASQITKSTLAELEVHSKENANMLVLNIPGEYKGAYILRNGFYDALVLKNIDTAFIRAINYINHEEYQSLPDRITPVYRNDSVYIGNSVVVYNKTIYSRKKPTDPFRAFFTLHNHTEAIWYWDKKTLVKFEQ
jgi:hypothetical protein